MRLNKTELPKKRIVVFMVEYSFSEPALLKKEGRLSSSLFKSFIGQQCSELYKFKRPLIIKPEVSFMNSFFTFLTKMAMNIFSQHI